MKNTEIVSLFREYSNTRDTICKQHGEKIATLEANQDAINDNVTEIKVMQGNLMVLSQD